MHRQRRIPSRAKSCCAANHAGSDIESGRLRDKANGERSRERARIRRHLVQPKESAPLLLARRRRVLAHRLHDTRRERL